VDCFAYPGLSFPFFPVPAKGSFWPLYNVLFLVLRKFESVLKAREEAAKCASLLARLLCQPLIVSRIVNVRLGPKPFKGLKRFALVPQSKMAAIYVSYDAQSFAEVLSRAVRFANVVLLAP